MKFIKFFLILAFGCSAIAVKAQAKVDTSYLSIAPPSIQRMIVRGKVPRFTIQVSAFYNSGLMDLAANDNTAFNKNDFVGGRNFGTRYGFGFSLIGKLPLHKQGNVRLVISGLYNRLQSNFVISETPEGKVGYNVFSAALGLENNFTPDRKFKPYIGADIIGSWIGGKANLATDTGNFSLKIKTAFRLGFALNLGFEYAFNNNVGFNLGVKLSHLNTLLKDSKESSNLNETYLNDKHVDPPILYSGWKQFFFSSFYTGINIYFGMKNKK
jgi:opacity protein-like surface antigen